MRRPHTRTRSPPRRQTPVRAASSLPLLTCFLWACDTYPLRHPPPSLASQLPHSGVTP